MYQNGKRTGMAGVAWFWLDTHFGANQSLKYASSLKRIDLLSFWKERVMGGSVTHSEIRKLCCKCTALWYKSEVFSVCLFAYQFQNSLPDFLQNPMWKISQIFWSFLLHGNTLRDLCWKANVFLSKWKCISEEMKTYLLGLCSQCVASGSQPC